MLKLAAIGIIAAGVAIGAISTADARGGGGGGGGGGRSSHSSGGHFSSGGKPMASPIVAHGGFQGTMGKPAGGWPAGGGPKPVPPMQPKPPHHGHHHGHWGHGVVTGYSGYAAAHVVPASEECFTELRRIQGVVRQVRTCTDPYR